MSKLYDIVARTGTYTNRNGEEKGRFENVGALMKGSNGQYIMLKRTFNPAGVPFKDGSDNIMLSLYEPKEQAETTQHQQAKANGYRPSDDLNNDIPF